MTTTIEFSSLFIAIIEFVSFLLFLLAAVYALKAYFLTKNLSNMWLPLFLGLLLFSTNSFFVVLEWVGIQSALIDSTVEPMMTAAGYAFLISFFVVASNDWFKPLTYR